MTAVAIIGGGIGGLTAAHELAESGYSVCVFEANDRFGGKARSMPADSIGTLQGEHGFRFFPAFYRHTIETMERTPTEHGTVADALTETEETLIAAMDGENSVAHTGQPKTLNEWLQQVQPAFAEELPRRDVRFLLERLLYILTSCDKRREEQLDEQSWWEFIDAENRSQEFRDRLAYATQALVALRPQVGSARTVGTIYLQLLFGQLDPTRPSERILAGPTSDEWIEPWISYLRSLGVQLHTDTPISTLETDGYRITGAVTKEGDRIDVDEFVLAVPVEKAPELIPDELEMGTPELSGIRNLDTAWMNGVQFFLSEDIQLSAGHQVYADAPWALTSISQRQFWTGYDFETNAPDEIEGVISVIASDWDTPGIVHTKPARRCTRKEIVEEIWEQLKAHLNDDNTVLRDYHLVDWFLDPAIIETETGVTNTSPLLINTVGSLKHRPSADPAVPNLTIAADYVRTNSDLASMESANEAGRRAANAIMNRHGGSSATIYPLKEPALFRPLKQQDRLRYRLGFPHPLEVTQSLRSARTKLGLS